VQLATEDHRSIEADHQGREEQRDDREVDRLPCGRVWVVLRHHDDGHGGHRRRHEGEPPEDDIERLPPPVGAPDERHGCGDRSWNDNPEVQQEDRPVHAHVGTELGRKRVTPQPREQGRQVPGDDECGEHEQENPVPSLRTPCHSGQLLAIDRGPRRHGDPAAQGEQREMHRKHPGVVPVLWPDHVLEEHVSGVGGRPERHERCHGASADCEYSREDAQRSDQQERDGFEPGRLIQQ
jgi:hypothetical protein